MQITVKTHHVSITDALKDYATKKMEKLPTFFDNIIDVIVELDFNESVPANQQHIARATLHASGHTFRASNDSESLYASIDFIVDKLERQLKKYKQKLRDNRHSGTQRHYTAGFEPSTEKQRIISKKKEEMLFIPKPMGVEDALILLNTHRLPFIAFRNIQTESVNILYPIAEDEVGLIET